MDAIGIEKNPVDARAVSPPSAREAALLTLHQRLQLVPGATVLRNEIQPAKIPAGGLVILRDGDPGEPEVTLNPVSYLWQHRAELEVLVEAATPAERDAALDALLVVIGEALADDPTLGGAVEWSEAGAPRTEDLAIEGAAALKGAVVPVTLVYTSATALG
jgi:hypothetical protein